MRANLQFRDVPSKAREIELSLRAQQSYLRVNKIDFELLGVGEELWQVLEVISAWEWVPQSCFHPTPNGIVDFLE